MNLAKNKVPRDSNAMDLRRKTKLGAIGENTNSLSPILNRSRSYQKSSKDSPNLSNHSWNSSTLKESFSEDDANPNLSDDDSSCEPMCEDEISTGSLRKRKEILSTSAAKTGKPSKVLISSKQTPNIKQPPLEDNSSTFGPVIIFLLAMALIGCLILTMFPFGPVMQESSKHVLRNSREIFETKLLKEVRTLQSTHPVQPMKTWTDFMAAITSIEGSPSQPAVLLLVTPNSTLAIETKQCIARRLAAVTNRLFNVSNPSIVIPIRKSSSGTEDKIREELDNQIHSILKTSYAIILDDIQNIPPKAAMVLHGYCDNFMALFKQRVIILTAVVNEGWPLNSNKVDDFLRNLWDPELGQDKSASLVSRVANVPVFIEPEESSTSCD